MMDMYLQVPSLKESFESNYFDITFDELGQWDFFIIEPDESLKVHVLGAILI